MNKFLKSLMAIALAAFVFTGCVEDPCDTLDCGLNGVPTESADGETCACECINGFGGANCAELSTGKFIGNWDAFDQCGEDDYAYDALISPDLDNQTQVKVFNFGGFGQDFSWNTEISGDTIIIPLSDVQGLLAEGMGIMSAGRDTINWQYSVTDNTGGAANCTGVWTRIE